MYNPLTKPLIEKVAVVTGASRGIGKGIALGLVRTERVLAAGVYDLSDSESPQFIGRAIAALTTDPNLMQKTGQTLVAAALALEYGFTDIDGKQPKLFTFQDAYADKPD